MTAYAATIGPGSPAPGVLCDKTLCADEHGLSLALITKYPGKRQGGRQAAAGEFDSTAFTFRGDSFGDTTERQYRNDRYFAPDGKRSGKVNTRYTVLLFGQKDNF